MRQRTCAEARVPGAKALLRGPSLLSRANKTVQARFWNKYDSQDQILEQMRQSKPDFRTNKPVKVRTPTCAEARAPCAEALLGARSRVLLQPLRDVPRPDLYPQKQVVSLPFSYPVSPFPLISIHAIPAQSGPAECFSLSSS